MFLQSPLFSKGADQDGRQSSTRYRPPQNGRLQPGPSRPWPVHVDRVASAGEVQ